MLTRDTLQPTVERIVQEQPVTDIHTHLYSPGFGDLLLWGVDELLCYHYLIAETFRWVDMPEEAFWARSTRERADLIWTTLFLEHTPYSEACRGVLTTLKRLGLDTSERDLDRLREGLAGATVEEYVDRVFEAARIDSVVMTNDPFDDAERSVWESGVTPDPRFRAALRIDPLLLQFDATVPHLQAQGYNVSSNLTAGDLAEVRRFLEDWIQRMNPLYMAVSLPDTFAYPDGSTTTRVIDECILPVGREHNLPFALMIGVRRGVNRPLASAGDAEAKADITAVQNLVSRYPGNKFLVTMLARENQHELCVTARKFRNLLIFGCWWFMNNPVLIDEVTRMRFEMLGSSVIPQHSDARILDQLVYKWDHSKRIITDVLVDKYGDLLDTGWQLHEEEVRRDVGDLFGGTFRKFLERDLP